MRRFVPFALCLILPAAAPAASWQRELLVLHNAERAAWRTAPLMWDDALAQSAQRWAAELTRLNGLRHSPKPWRPGQGENLWMGTNRGYSIRAMVGSWASERRWFRPNVFPAVSTTGRWADVGHYTQMIASRTTHVGCALSSNVRWTFLVCRYGPSGNVDGWRIP